MKNNLLKSVLTIVFAVAVVAVFIFLAKPNNSLTKVTKQDGSASLVEETTGLDWRIDEYMESQKSEDDLGKDNYYCSHIAYGHDIKYVYAWIYCSGFIIKSDGELEQETAFSAPIRLEYAEPDLQIIGYKMPTDGEDYGPSLKELFPSEFYEKAKVNPSNAEIENLYTQLRSKAKADNSEIVSEGEIKNISTPANIVRFEEKENNTFVELDFVTHMNVYDYAVYRLTHGACSLPGMSTKEALIYAKEKLYQPYANAIRQDIGLFQEHCIDGYISVDFGGSVNRSTKIRSYPISDSFKVINSCGDATTLASIKDQVENSGDIYVYSEYGTGGQYIPKVDIINGEVVDFDFIRGCVS